MSTSQTPPKRGFDIEHFLSRRANWLVMASIMLFSMRHGAATTLSMEPAGTWDIWGWLLGGSVDTGVIITALALRRDQNNRVLRAGFIAFLAMMAFGNLNHTFPHAGFEWIVEHEYWRFTKVILFAGLLPFLIWMMEQTFIVPHPSTDLAVASQPSTSTSDHQPNISVDNPNRQPRTPRRINRPSRKALPSDQSAVMPRFNSSTSTAGASTFTPSTASTERKVEGDRVEELQPSTATTTLTMVEDEELQKAVDAVRMFQLSNSLSEVGRQQGISAEGVRKRLRKAYHYDAAWVKEQIPDWVQKNQAFLNG